MNQSPVVVGFFPEFDQAEQAAEEIVTLGVRKTDVELIKEEGFHDDAGQHETGEKAFLTPWFGLYAILIIGLSTVAFWILAPVLSTSLALAVSIGGAVIAIGIAVPMLGRATIPDYYDLLRVQFAPHETAVVVHQEKLSEEKKQNVQKIMHQHKARVVV